MADWKDILSNKEEQANEDELINYLEGNLSEEEKYAFEQKTADSDFVNDAVEGLSNFNSKQRINDYVNQLNKNLHKQLDQRKKRKEKRMLKENPWIIISVIIILALAVIAFVAIKIHRDSSSTKTQTGSVVYKNEARK